MRDRRLIRFTKLVLDVMFYTGFVIILTLPVSLKFLGKYYSVVISEYFMFMFAVFAASGIFGILIIRQLRRMMRTVIEESCFVYENVKSLNNMAVLSLCIDVCDQDLYLTDTCHRSYHSCIFHRFLILRSACVCICRGGEL